MNIVQITPGAGGMYCGNCFRDNALVGGLRKLGHSTLMVPLYLPMTLDEADNSGGTPLFFNGLNVYLEQKSAFFRKAPRWLHDVLASPRLLQWASGRAAKTRPTDAGEITLSMLRGEAGHQARELDELIVWLKTQAKPDVVCLSNALLIGMLRRIKSDLRVPVICMLQGEDTFLDALPEPLRTTCWKTLAERATEADLFIAPSRYYGDLMGKRLGLRAESVRVVFNGINLESYSRPRSAEFTAPNAGGPVLGFFARMCREKGLDLLVDAYLLLRKRDRVKNVRLRVGGGCGPSDEPFVEAQRRKLKAAGVLDDVQFFPNLDHAAKVEFFRSLTVMSTPALYGEAFGLYLIEAMAAGVPVVQPRHGAFPELMAATGGGVICPPTAEGLAQSIEQLLHDPIALGAFSEAGRKSVFQHFSVEHMAGAIARLCQEVCSNSQTANQKT
jgi:glycosyltransferase involved in cell wall biosynthesis